uniref:Ig-like domain-containing protein n=1 Tax=Latimeria chalumnae TaxID=7897 RepID=H3BAP7_LATCH
QVAVSQSVVTAYKGQSYVTLSFSASRSTVLISWYRGVMTEQQNLILTWAPSLYSRTNGPQYTGRESAYSRGYLRIRNVFRNDTGNYTVRVTLSDASIQTAMLELQVTEELQEASAGVSVSNPLEGGSVTMTFNVQGTPDTILWYKDQKPLLISTETRSISDENRIRLSSDNKTLTISSVSRTDSGIYQGEASNPVSTSRSEEMKIDISYGPDTPIITLDSNPIFLGSRVTLNCTAASSPAPNYEWNFNDNKKSTGQFLTIPVVSVSDVGTYTCLAFNTRTNLRSRKHLELKVTGESPIVITKCDITSEVLISSENELEAKSILDVFIILKPHIKAISLSFSPSLPPPLSVFLMETFLFSLFYSICRNSWAKSCDRYTAYWYRGPAYFSNGIRYLSIYYYYYGSPSYYSQSNGQQYTGREEISNNGSLLIRDVLTNYTGNYTVVISGYSVSVTAIDTVELKVYEELQEASAGVNVSNPLEGGSVTMTFNVQGTPDTILWYKDQKLLVISAETRSVGAENRIRLSSDNKTLTISSVSRTDSGIYQGEASNPVSTSRSEEMKIDISYGPDTPIITLESNPVLVGSKVTLNCTAASSPAPNYEWNFNDKKKSTGQLLTIPVVSISDAGTYTCLAFNTKTNLRSRKHLELKVTESEKPIPSPTAGSTLSIGQIVGIVVGSVLG